MQNLEAVPPINTDFYFSKQLKSRPSSPSKGKETQDPTQDKQGTNAGAQMGFLAEDAALAGWFGTCIPATLLGASRDGEATKGTQAAGASCSGLSPLIPNCFSTCCRHRCPKAWAGDAGGWDWSHSSCQTSPFSPDTFSYVPMMRRGTEHVVSPTPARSRSDPKLSFSPQPPKHTARNS